MGGVSRVIGVKEAGRNGSLPSASYVIPTARAGSVSETYRQPHNRLRHFAKLP